MKLILATVLSLSSSIANAEILCVRGEINIENGRIVNSDVVRRGEKIDCPEDTTMMVQEPELPQAKTVLSSTEIIRLRNAAKAKQVAQTQKD